MNKWNHDIKIGDYVFAAKYGKKDFESPWFVGYISRITHYYNNTTTYMMFEKDGKTEYWYEFRYVRRISGNQGQKLIDEGMLYDDRKFRL